MKLICILFLQLLIASKIFSQQVKMEKIGGVYQIPCKVNGLNLKFIFDTGASDVSISLSEAVFMLKNGYLKAEDLGETQYYQLANGTVAEGTKIIIRKLEIGNKTLNNVYASIIHNSSAPLLLGQSALKKLGKYSFDYSTNTLTIGEKDKITTNENSINNSSCILYQGSGVYFIYQNKLSGANEKNIQEGKNVVLKYIKVTKNWQISYTDMDGLFQILELTFVKMNNYDAIMVDSHGGKYNVTNGIKKDEMLFCHLLDFSGDYNVYMSFESVKPVN